MASQGPAGTGPDIAAWRGRGGRSLTIRPDGANRSLARPAPGASTPFERVLAAILFTDFQGFSKLSELKLPVFWDGVMRAVAEVLDDYSDAIDSRNSWAMPSMW